MSVRPREWTTRDGKVHRAWVVDYRDKDRKSRLKTFKTRKAADEFDAQTKGELKRGVHVPDSVSSTVEQAGKLWVERAESERLGMKRSGITGCT